MKDNMAVVVTSIAAPNDVLAALAGGCLEHGHNFYVIGDEKSPPEFKLRGCQFFSLEKQFDSGFKFAGACPTRHYARKNIGYLLAIRDGAKLIAETDDDNFPYASFWEPRHLRHRVPTASGSGWVNVYRYFSEANIWPRGLPLVEVRKEAPAFASLPVREQDCPVQQGLNDDNPDVDAIYRLTLPLPQSFRGDRRVALASGAWCPFNSQNTSWWPDAFPLLYLPAYCSFRMTDIWRSFVAQRIAWEHGWSILFHEPTMRQKRNEHDLLKDFEDEIPGYLNNGRIRTELDALKLHAGKDRIGENLRICYGKLVGLGVINPKELDLLDAWLSDLGGIRQLAL